DSGVQVALRGVRGAGGRVWVVGDGGTILAGDAGSFAPASLAGLTLPAGLASRSVWARNANEAYAVGDGGVILRWDGRELTERDGTVHPPRWVRHKSGTANVLRTAWGVGDLDVFAGGDVAVFTHYQLSDK